MRASLWWIPKERIRELSATDLAVLRMCRVITLFCLAGIVYLVVIMGRGAWIDHEHDRLRHQIDRCGCAEAP